MSNLIRYRINDFVFTDLQDSSDRHDIFFNVDGSTHVTVIPRVKQEESARDRFTRASEKASRVPVVRRLDLTDRPQSFVAATTRVPERQVVVGTSKPKDKGAKSSVTIKHFHTHERPTRPGSRGL